MTLYDDDFVSWTRQQAAILRSMPATQGLDIENLSDEIEGLGRSAVADLSNAIRQVMAGLVRRSIDPAAVSLDDIYSAQSEAAIRADAGIWKHVDIDRVWRLAKRSTDVELPEICPLTIEQMIMEDFDVSTAISTIKQGT